MIGTCPTPNTSCYDAAGNLVGLTGSSNAFTYDALSMAQSSQLGSNTLKYTYTADDERVATYSGGSLASNGSTGTRNREYDSGPELTSTRYTAAIT